LTSPPDPLPSVCQRLRQIKFQHTARRYLSHRLLDDYDAIIEAASRAWNKLIAETARLTSLT
jgi:hypothetical protein